MAGRHANLKRQHVAFARGTLADAHVHFLAATLLAVQGVVLDVRDHMLRTFAADALANECAGEHRIFAHVLKGATVARIARDVGAAAERHVVALRAQLLADERAVSARSFGVPAGRGNQCWKLSAVEVAAVGGAEANAVGSVVHLNAWDAHIALMRGAAESFQRAAVALVLHGQDLRRHILPSGHAFAVYQHDFLVQRHFVQHHVGALRWGQRRCIHPWLVAAWRRALLRQQNVARRRPKSEATCAPNRQLYQTDQLDRLTRDCIGTPFCSKFERLQV